MIDRTALLLLDAKINRHSLNALVGALETDRALDDLELRLPTNESQLASHLAELRDCGKKAVVGVSFTTFQIWQVRDMMRRLAGRSDDAAADAPDGVFWVAGGPHPTADPEGTLRLGFDAVVQGEGETAFLELLKAILAQGDVSEVPGVVVRRAPGTVPLLAGAITGRPPSRRSPIDLDAFPPFPLWRRRVVGPIEITRGCPFACGYCQTSHLLGMRPRHRGIDSIARYAAVIRQRGLRDVRVVTPNAFSYGSPDGKTLNLPAMESLLAALRETVGPEGRFYFGSFPSEVRPEHVTDDTVALVKRYANNDNLVIGAQSGSQRLLEHCRRGHTVADILAAASRTVAAGFKAQIDFIFGLPGETVEDLNETVELIRELVAIGAVIHAHAFTPLPQTPFALEPPGRIHGRLRPLIKELIRNGHLHGIWHKQERQAKQISQYLRRGEW